MRKSLWAAAALAVASVPSFGATVGATAIFDSAPVGLYGNWSIGFTSSDAALQLQSVTVNLNGSRYLDTTFALPGALLPLDFSNQSGAAATGFTSVTPSTAAGRNGATSFTLNFSHFEGGESFGFDMDVDDCASFLSLGCAVVSGANFAGATIAFTIGGPGYTTTTYTETFADRVSTASQNDAIASFRASLDADVPEPSTWVLLGSALTGLGLMRRRRA